MVETRKVEEKMAGLFSTKRPFSAHLFKWEDPLLPDKYDHNCFEYSGQPSREELEEAIRYQRSIGAAFIKLEGDEPLLDSFGLELSITLTMVLRSAGQGWKTNPALVFHAPSLSELEDMEDLLELERKVFGPVYGEDFTHRNIRRLYEKLTFHGAYLDGKLVGAGYSFSDSGFTCIDGLIVDTAYRKRCVATSLIKHIKESCPDTILFLHADDDDSPKDMYLKMGFEISDRLYEYFSLLH